MKKYFTFFAGSFILLCINCTTVHAQFTDGQNANIVLGQPNFKTSTTATLQSGMNTPRGVAIDKSGNLYVADESNNRVMIFKNALSKTNGSNADFELGQPDFTSSASATTQNRMNGPISVYVDSLGNLYVIDYSRVLIFKNIVSQVNAGTLVNGANADFVLGQINFTSSAGGVTQGKLLNAWDVITDLSGNLYVSDYFGDRLLIFKNAVSLINAGTLVNGANADFVLGQTSFTSFGISGPTQSDFAPQGIVLDRSGNLYASDYYNGRVIIFKNIVAMVNAGTLVNGANANFVLGSTNFTSTLFGTRTNSFASPDGLGIDAAGNLYVADCSNNNRIMIFNNIVSQVTNSNLVNGSAANIVLGQSAFNTNTPGTAIDSLSMSFAGIALDASGNLYVADDANNRVMIFANSALPVTLLNFIGKLNGNEAILTWSTATEINNKGFEVERSTDGEIFTDIGFVAGVGNSNVLQKYQYLDNPGVEGKVFYRLKQIDLDGNFVWSPTVYVTLTSKGIITFMPNPALNSIIISSPVMVKEVRLLSIEGRIVKVWNSVSPSAQLDLGTIASGTYLIEFINDQSIQTQKLVKE